MTPGKMLTANIPCILFIVFAAYCLYLDKNGLAIAAFVVAAITATIFVSKDK